MTSVLLWAVLGAAAGWAIGHVYIDWFHISATEWRSYYWIGRAMGIGFVAGGVAGWLAARPWLALLGVAVVALAAGWILGDRPPDLWLEVEVRGAVGEGGVSMNAVGRDGLDEMHSTLGMLRPIDEGTMSAKLPFATAKAEPHVHVRVKGLHVAGFRLALACEEDWSVWSEGEGGYVYRYRVRRLEP